jgi:transmembrane sensor
MSDLHPDLLKRYAEGKCSPGEQLQVEAWLNADGSGDRAPVEAPLETGTAIWQGLLVKAAVKSGRKQRTMWFSVTAAACILLVASLLLFKESIFRQREISSSAMIRYTVPAGQVVKLILPDNSTVKLAGGSSIVYPKVFSGGSRTVNFIRGEAFFAIQHDKERPFLVNIANNQIKVLGTRFNVSQRATEQLSVTLAQGSVSFKTQDQTETVLKPGQQLNYDLIRHTVAAVIAVDTAYVTSWSQGILWFKQTPMHQVLEKLESHYGVTFSLQGNPDLRVPMTAKFEHQPLSKVLKLIQNSTALRFKQENNKFIIY